MDEVTNRIYTEESNVRSTIGKRRHRVFRDLTFRLILLAIVLFDVSSRDTPIISISLECRAIVSTALTYPMAKLLLHADTTVNLFTSYFDVGRLVTWRDVYTTLEYDS